MAKINIQDYKVDYTDKFFFDTNIWLLLYGTFAEYQKKEQKKYATFFQDLLQRNCAIFLTAMVLSEFSNVILRRDFKQLVSANKFNNLDFKKSFVGTTNYEESVATITAIINKITRLPNVILVGDNFNSIDKGEILNNFKSIDFNDSYYVQLAIMNNYKIVTNDKDFLILDNKVDIITANI